MTMEFGFCAHCGAKISPETSFCPECGTQVGTAGTNVKSAVETPGGQVSTRLVVVTILAALLAALALVIAIPMIANLDSLMASIISLPSWPDIVNELYNLYGWTEEQTIEVIRGTMLWLGYYFAVVAVIAVASVVICILRKYWIFGLICMIVVSFMMAVTILGLVIGVLVTYFYYSSKSEFIS